MFSIQILISLFYLKIKISTFNTFFKIIFNTFNKNYRYRFIMIIFSLQFDMIMSFLIFKKLYPVNIPIFYNFKFYVENYKTLKYDLKYFKTIFRQKNNITKET